VLTTLAATVLVLAASVGWLSTQWYLAIYPPTRVVAVYQGIPVAGLNRLVEISSLPAAELPEYESAQVSATISVASLSDAESTIAQLTTRAAACKLTPTTPGCPTVSP
jgi:hypothetical protein